MSKQYRQGQFNGDQYADRIDNIAGNQVNYNDASGWAAFQNMSGVPKLFVVVGLLIFFVGFAMFLFFVLSFMMFVLSAMGSTEPPDMSSISKIAIPWLPVGIVLAFVGIIIANIAMAVGRPRYR